MKSYSTTIAIPFATLIALFTTFNLMPPTNFLTKHLIYIGAWIVTKIPYEYRFGFAPALATGICIGIISYIIIIIIFWRLEIWSAGLASKIANDALNPRGKQSVEQEMHKLIEKYGRKK